MARQIAVTLDGVTTCFDFKKVDRSKLYGRRVRVPLDGDGEPCTRASLTADGSTLIRVGMTAQGYFDEDGTWVAVCPMNGVSILHPVFSRRREDKAIDRMDVRASQVLERCLLAVRKLLIWKTNKEQADPSYPAFVVHWTDYSPGRKAPLKREVRLAPTLAQANDLAEVMIVKGVKRGWNAV
ncbi:MAG TPA: hypothetical protein QGF58_09235 [Myxococcota bacterium]|nr:hypothetical protein [Myxococcota bacterium]